MQYHYALTILIALICATSASADRPGKTDAAKAPAKVAKAKKKKPSSKKATPSKEESSAEKPAQADDKSEAAKKAPAPEQKKKEQEKEEEKKPAPKRPIAPADYAQWEGLNMGNRKLSPDGNWLLFDVKRVDEKSSLHLHRVKDGKTSEEKVYQQGERPAFSTNSQWLAVTVGKSPEEKKKAKSSKTPPSPGATILLRHLADGKATEFKNVGTLIFSNDSRFAAIEVMGKGAARPSGPPRPGAPAPPQSSASKALLIRNLEKGTDTTFGNVTRFAWSDGGALLAMVVDSPSISNSLQLFDPSTGVLRTLETSDQDYAALVWRKDSLDLAAMRKMKHGDKEDVSHVLISWRNLDPATSMAEPTIYDHSQDRSFSADHYIPTGLSWSRDGKSLHCKIKKWETKPKDFPSPPDPKKKKKGKRGKKGKKKAGKKAESEKTAPEKKEGAESKTPEEKKEEKQEEAKKPSTLRDTVKTPSNVEVWHSKDATIMPRQKKEAGTRKNPPRSAVWWIDSGRLVELESELTEHVTIPQDGSQAVGIDHTPHERTAMFGPRLFDVYAVNMQNGKRKKILEATKYTLSISPNGRHLLYLQEGQVWSHDLKTGVQRNLSGKLDTHFTNQTDDTLAKEKRAYGSGTWLTDSSAVLLYDRFDIWLIAPQGGRTLKLTDGAKDQVRHRISQASFREENRGAIDAKDPVYLGLYGERTKKSGYARLTIGPKGRKAAKLETLLWEDKMFLYLERAKDADVFTYTTERTDLSRNLYLTDSDLKDSHQVTTTNAFQEKFHWGKSELIDFKNKHGVSLQGALTYPANYEKGKKYPMIVYIYERRSQELHRYYTPSEKHPYNPCVFSAEGYFVFQPDIVYRPQEPGISAVDCVVPAVEKVLKSGMVDPKRVGLMGHSWGAYQTSFIVTQTDLFAAGVAGAPLTDLMSMSVSVYWNSGNTNAWIFSQSQGRMDKPFWRDMVNYARNSPIHGLDTLNTPLLITFGDQDGAVDWDQGVEMYNAARWAGKEDVVMLVYPGENHGLRKEENMVDYHYRVKEWMAHHVKGAETEAPKWITEGKSFLEREQEKKEKK